ncbi:MAG: GIY-YIG nuclease family protein [Caulobacteraceae bacterium]
MAFWTYILASRRNGTLYTGCTDDLIWRVTQHKEHQLPGFTDRYGVTRLVWYEEHDSREEAFLRERRIKRWRRAWKIALIETGNPGWRDLFDDLQEPVLSPDSPLRET